MKTVFVNGTFDILHPGHMQLFKVARSLGDRVICATDSDQKIREDKPDTGKPINNLPYRITMLESIKYIDTVLWFNTMQELSDLIQLYRPDILLLGDDWRNGVVIGAEFAQEVRFFPRIEMYSSSKVISQIKSLVDPVDPSTYE
tara:strand:- start:8653 stop:9084 length:432 start_codon:yes stop_codon:yes gene_type:complete